MINEYSVCLSIAARNNTEMFRVSEVGIFNHWSLSFVQLISTICNVQFCWWLDHTCFSQYTDYVHPYWLLYRPYHGVLLLEEKQVLQDSLPMDCSPSLSRLITVCSPQQSLQVLSQEADLTLSQVKFTLSLVKHTLSLVKHTLSRVKTRRHR